MPIANRQYVPPEDWPESLLWQAQFAKDHPVYRDQENVLRYEPNPLIMWMLEHANGQISLNDMWIAFLRGDTFTRDEFMEFYRDIGYSLSGFDEIWGKYIGEHEIDEELFERLIAAGGKKRAQAFDAGESYG